ncbi:MAG: diadenylate cyclase CdaA [Firmicutes bacterium]|nr:diadenylate cyclase CdaA [Bacillota bacterium]
MKDFFANIISDIGIADVLDVLVVAFIIYLVLGFIKETRAQQLVRGLIMLAALFLLSDFLELNALNWILKGATTFGLIAIIIIFQPELRRALEYMGRGSMIYGRLAKLDKNKAKELIDAIVEAVDSFSATRTGALIVIENQVSLGDIAESGTIVNADITAELLGNIFYKGSPMHDGAAIIRNDKLYAAGCVLPLSGRLDLNKELGTRHRAAIGITENSDAIALIVSEENGVISMAKEGKLNRFLDAKELEKILLNLYLAEQEESAGFLSRIKSVLLGGDQNAKQ